MPGARLPLQLFEARYVRLLRDLLEHQDEQPPLFGVVAIRDGFEVGEGAVRALHHVGCAALLTHCSALGDDRFLVVARGTSRFRLHSTDDSATPYLMGEVSWLSEPDGDPAAVADLSRRVRAELAAYRSLTGTGTGEPPKDDRELSYWVPDAVTFDLADRQRLLASADTESRLRVGLQLVRRERGVAVSLGAVGRPPDLPMNLN
jgi:Lon protease-like protein